MQLTLNGIKDTSSWEKANVSLPSYDVISTADFAKESPRWVHFGIGNIFRVFIGGIADELLRKGDLDRGLCCVETFDFDVVDKIYTPFDNLGLSVILNGDGTRTLRVLGSFAESIQASPTFTDQWERLKEVFKSRSLQLVSFTITEKGYALKNAEGTYFPFIMKDIENGPEHCSSAMAILTSMLYQRFLNGAVPIALVSMDNCSHNGALLRSSVLSMAAEWKNKNFVTDAFLSWISDESCVSFPWTMIDKITPRPSTAIADDLEKLGIEHMQPVITEKRTYIAPFINAEGPQYLVIEDHFPNGRPALDHAYGVYLADRETVNKSERMKVTACLNPVHSALGPLQVVLGIDQFAEGLKDPALLKMGRMVAYDEGLPMVADPGIISPKAFTDELFLDRFPNEFLGDTNLRLSTDVSQGVGVRFGETIKAYKSSQGSASCLTAIPFGIAGWLRYMMGVDDHGNSYELAPDPMNESISNILQTIKYDDPSSLKDQLKPILSNENIFFINLYEAGIGEKIEEFFREMINGKNSTRTALEKYFK